MGLSERWSQWSQRLSLEFPGFPVLIEFRSHWGVTSQEWKALSFFIDPIWEVKIDHQPSWAHRHRPQYLHGLLSVIHSFCRGSQAILCTRTACLWWRNPAFLRCAVGQRDRSYPPTPTQIGRPGGSVPELGRRCNVNSIAGLPGGIVGEVLTLGGGISELSTRHIFKSFLLHLTMG